MSRAGQRVMVCVLLLLALAAGIAGYLYYQFYAPTGAAVRHAESAMRHPAYAPDD